MGRRSMSPEAKALWSKVWDEIEMRQLSMRDLSEFLGVSYEVMRKAKQRVAPLYIGAEALKQLADVLQMPELSGHVYVRKNSLVAAPIETPAASVVELRQVVLGLGSEQLALFQQLAVWQQANPAFKVSEVVGLSPAALMAMAAMVERLGELWPDEADRMKVLRAVELWI